MNDQILMVLVLLAVSALACLIGIIYVSCKIWKIKYTTEKRLKELWKKEAENENANSRYWYNAYSLATDKKRKLQSRLNELELTASWRGYGRKGT